MLSAFVVEFNFHCGAFSYAVENFDLVLLSLCVGLKIISRVTWVSCIKDNLTFLSARSELDFSREFVNFHITGLAKEEHF